LIFKRNIETNTPDNCHVQCTSWLPGKGHILPWFRVLLS